MKVIVDTCIWSKVLRRQKNENEEYTQELTNLLNDFRVQLIGPIRQEVLSGLSSIEQFNKLKHRLSAFPDLHIDTLDYEKAASYFNQCRKKGIQGSHTDFLICAVAVNKNMLIFTNDKDFKNYQKILPINIYDLTNSKN